MQDINNLLHTVDQNDQNHSTRANKEMDLTRFHRHRTSNKKNWKNRIKSYQKEQEEEEHSGFNFIDLSSS